MSLSDIQYEEGDLYCRAHQVKVFKCVPSAPDVFHTALFSCHALFFELVSDPPQAGCKRPRACCGSVGRDRTANHWQRVVYWQAAHIFLRNEYPLSRVSSTLFVWTTILSVLIKSSMGLFLCAVGYYLLKCHMM